MNLKNRNDLPQYLSGLGVEVGVDRGEFSERLLRDSKLTHLWSIDPWDAKPLSVHASILEADTAYYQTCHRLEQFNSRSSIPAPEIIVPNSPHRRSTVLRLTGQQASLQFARHSLDFVYIDAYHTYHDTLQQMHLWWYKLKPNGLLAGHDYLNGWDCVKVAVDEFAAFYKLPVSTTEHDADFPKPVNSWMIRKPETPPAYNESIPS